LKGMIKVYWRKHKQLSALVHLGST
jgi:hypothetical protein